MNDHFYSDILMSGQHLVATIKDGKCNNYIVDSVEDISVFLQDYQDCNSYHALGAYRGLEAGYTPTRTPSNPFGLRAFAFDLDVGPEDHKYDTLEEAFTAFNKCIEDGHMPEPRWLVYSGGGLQFYQVLGGLEYDNGLPEELWSTRFQQLKKHLLPHLKLDKVVGSKPHSLLRSPCTPNWNYDEPVQPEVLNEEPGPLLDIEWFEQFDGAEPAPISRNYDNEDSSLQCENPVNIKQVVKACNAVKVIQDTRGKDASYPVWFATGNVCAHTFQFRKGFHALSDGHTDYDVASTDAQFDHILTSAASGPVGCHHFGDPDDPESPCYGCWAAKQGLPNPISATRWLAKTPENRKKKPKPEPVVESEEEEVEETEAVLDGLVDEFDDDGNWIVPEHHVPDGLEQVGPYLHNEDGPACEVFKVRPLQYNVDRDVGNVLVSLDGHEWHTITARKLAMPGTAAAELLNVGIMVFHDKDTMLYVRQASMLDPSSLETGRFGWDMDFKSAYLPNGSVGDVITEPSRDLIKLQKKWAGQKGTLEGWLKAVEIYGRPGQEPYLMSLLASLSSPLLAYHSLEKGVIMSLTGEGGTGKTTALKAASSIWGKPVSTLASMSSSFTATRIYLGLCGHLPMFLDEITQMPAEDLKQFALEISQGLGRERSTKDATLAHSEIWQLNCLTTSNTSVHAKLAELVDTGSADMNRVLEVPVYPSQNVSLQQGVELLDAISDNHGHLGAKFMEHYLTLDMEKERGKFKRLLKELRAKDSLRGSDRFADSLIASCFWAHRHIKEVVPEFPGDPDEMFMWMRKLLQSNNKFIRDTLKFRIPSPDDFYMEFVSENLLVEKTGDNFQSAGTALKGYVYDMDEYIVIPKSVLDGWCRRNQIKARTVLDSWAKSGRLRNMSKEPGQVRWTGKLDRGIKINGRTKYPTVTLLYKSHDNENTQATPRYTRRTANGDVPFKAH